MASLVSMIESLLPIDNKSKVDLVVEILRERNTIIDFPIEVIVYRYIKDPVLVSYYREKKKTLKHNEKISSRIVEALIVSLEPINSVMKMNKIVEGINKYGYTITNEDKEKIKSSITNDIVLQHWLTISDNLNNKPKDKNVPVVVPSKTKKKNVPSETAPRRNLPSIYIPVRTEADINTLLAFFKANKEELTPIVDYWIRLNIIKGGIKKYYTSIMSSSFSNYRDISKSMERMSKTRLLTRGNHKIEDFCIKFDEFKNKKNTDISKKGKSSFSILQKKQWILDWNCVTFKRGYIVLFAPTDGSVKFKPTNASAPQSIESFNYLKKYLNERLPPVRCIIDGQSIKIIDEINFKSAIRQFAAAARQGAITAKGMSYGKKIKPMQMSFSQALSKAKQMTPEEFKKYKSKYIDFLVSLQSKRYKVIPCVERLVHTTGDTTEYAFLFSIECSSGNILIVHENVNPDRSTLLFKVKEAGYNNSIREIYDFLQSAETNKRSSLRDKDLNIKGAGIINYRSINHDDIYSWSNTIKNSVG